ncbi:MAG: Bifunctional NAD(P)H-hydrate repair enzyme Nnr [Myxococcota bacterium]|nr:Bifunctional NAD(P)H-hydrate repair enzyme Nnr [Myxococcota bacterium]
MDNIRLYLQPGVITNTLRDRMNLVKAGRNFRFQQKQMAVREGTHLWFGASAGEDTVIKVISCEQMRQIDKIAVKEYNIPEVVLMENAGRAVAEAARRMISHVASPRVCVWCGPGSNGGDGFVVARHLIQAGLQVDVNILAPEARFTEAAWDNLRILKKISDNVTFLVLKEHVDSFTRSTGYNYDLLVDAMLGTGVKGAPREPIASAIEWCNQSRIPILSVDVPSGIDADRDIMPEKTIRATRTVTLAYAKPALVMTHGARVAGELEIADISIPHEITADLKPYAKVPESKDIAVLLPVREPWTHKGDYGHVAIIAGSRHMPGASYLAARAALRAGSGLVTLASVEPVIQAGSGVWNELLYLPLGGKDTLDADAYVQFKDHVERFDAVCFGPGSSSQPGVREFLECLLADCDQTIVLDADGLNVIGQDVQVLKSAKAPVILTPHPGEAGRMLGMDSNAIQQDRVGSAQRLRDATGAHVALKGSHTILATMEGDLFINPTGNPGMATAGMGDVLAGVITSLAGQKLESAKAAMAGVYLHGLAGDIAAKSRGAAGLLSTDVIDSLPAALQSLGR